jgi:hypothetical protein
LTVCADSRPELLGERMRERDLTSLPVRTPAGQRGLVRAEDLEPALAPGRP